MGLKGFWEGGGGGEGGVGGGGGGGGDRERCVLVRRASLNLLFVCEHVVRVCVYALFWLLHVRD